jgi:glycerol-3-phosphate acyltransferase PlsY
LCQTQTSLILLWYAAWGSTRIELAALERSEIVAIWRDLVAIVVAYVLGCIATAYYLVRLRTGQDIRQLGSGTVGGRNAGRVLGASGFALVSIGDALKGLLAVLFARAIGVDEWSLVAVILAVLAGHIWPAQLGFKGGKGFATLMGALLGYNFSVALLIAGLFLLLFAIMRSFTFAGLLAIALAPCALPLLGQSWGAIISAAVPIALVIFAHRTNLLSKLQGHAGATQPVRPMTRRGE